MATVTRKPKTTVVKREEERRGLLRRLFTPERRAWPLDDDEVQLRASTRKLLDLVEREHVALVVCGHDAEQWQTLKKAPDSYN